MIDFRYHLVSIVSIFLALAVGLLLGSTVLRPYALEGLQRVSKVEKHEIDSLLQTRDQLQRQIAADNQFAQANAPVLLHQLLEGQQVVLVLARQVEVENAVEMGHNLIVCVVAAVVEIRRIEVGVE